MKTKTIYGSGICGLGALCLALVAGVADAKPGKDKGKGGNPGHAEKGKGGKHNDKPGFEQGKKADFKKGEKADFQHGKNTDFGHDDKGHDKAAKELRKDVEKASKENEKDAKEFAKWREKRFRDEDRNSVIEYFGKYRDNEFGLPPGLAKNLRRGKSLPPGWQKKLVSGYVIEDDYYDDFYPLSYDLFPGMDVVPETRLYRYGDRIVRVYEPRREIIDVINVPTLRFD